jgi:hypothetical protein
VAQCIENDDDKEWLECITMSSDQGKINQGVMAAYASWLFAAFSLATIVVCHIFILPNDDNRLESNVSIIGPANLPSSANNATTQDLQKYLIARDVGYDYGLKLRRLEDELEKLRHASEVQQEKIQNLRSVLDADPSRNQGNKVGLQSRLEGLEEDFDVTMNLTFENKGTFSRQGRQAHRLQLKQEESSYQADFLRSEISQLKLDLSLAQIDRLGIKEIVKGGHGEEYLNPLQTYPGTFCIPWTVNSDEWWTHHVDWFVSKENETDYCFSPMQGFMKRNMFH